MQLLRRPKQLDEAALHRKIERGQRAEHLAQDEALAAAFKEVEEVYVTKWQSSDALDVELRERAWIATRLLSDLRAQILHTVREGAAAREMIEKALRQ